MKNLNIYWQQFIEIFGRECYAMYCRPWPTVLLYLTPLFFGILFGAVYMQNMLEHIPIAIYDEDQSSLSRKLIQVYGDTVKFDIVAYPSTSEELRQLLAEETVQVGVEIPNDFSESIKLGHSTEIALTINAANNIIANSSITSFEEDNRSFSVSVAQQLMESYGLKPQEAMDAAYPVHLGTRILHNPTAGYTNFMLPGIVMNGLQIALLLTVAPLLTSVLRRKIYSSKYSTIVLMAAKLIPYFLTGTAAFFIAILEIQYLWDIPMRGSWLDLVLLINAYMFAIIGALSLVSAVALNELNAIQMPLLYIMPSLLYSGFSWPLMAMQGVGKAYAYTMPITYSADTMRDIMLNGYAPELWQHIAILLAMGTGCSLAACLAFYIRKKRIRSINAQAYKEDIGNEPD